MSRLDLALPRRLDRPALEALVAQLEQAPEDAVLVLRGESDEVFCEGLSLEAMTRASRTDLEVGLGAYRRVALTLAMGDRATVARVRGRALGGGLGLAAACDVVVCEEQSRLGCPEPIFGLIPGLVTPLLCLRTSPAAVRRLAVAGESVSAEGALRDGLVDEITVAETLDARVSWWVRRLGRAYSPAAGRLRRWLADMEQLEDDLGVGVEHMRELLVDPEVAKRVERFAAGMAPWSSEGSPDEPG